MVGLEGREVEQGDNRVTSPIRGLRDQPIYNTMIENYKIESDTPRNIFLYLTEKSPIKQPKSMAVWTIRFWPKIISWSAHKRWDFGRFFAGGQPLLKQDFTFYSSKALKLNFTLTQVILSG